MPYLTPWLLPARWWYWALESKCRDTIVRFLFCQKLDYLYIFSLHPTTPLPVWFPWLLSARWETRPLEPCVGAISRDFDCLLVILPKLDYHFRHQTTPIPVLNIGIDNKIEVIVVSPTSWEAHHSPRATLVTPQWRQFCYQFLFYHDASKHIVRGPQTRHMRFLVVASLSCLMPARTTMPPTGIGGGNHAKMSTYHCTICAITNSLGHNLSFGILYLFLGGSLWLE